MSQDKLIAALINAQKDIAHAKADGRNPMFKNEYATYEQVVDTVKPVLLDNGIYFQQKSHIHERGACVETVFYGHGATLETGPVLVVADKATPQGFGSAMTYAKRYSLGMACAIGTSPDDDAETVEKAYRKPKAVPASQVVPSKKIEPSKDAFKLMKDRQTLIAKNTPEEFLSACRDLLADPSDANCQAIYKASKGDIDKASQKADGDTKIAFTTLTGLYGDRSAS